MLKTLREGSTVDDAIVRAENQDPELRRMRLAVDVAGRRLATAAGSESVQANRVYRTAMRQLLHYLATVPLQTPH